MEAAEAKPWYDQAFHAPVVLFTEATRRRLAMPRFVPARGCSASSQQNLREHNDASSPFVWTKPADKIPAKLPASSERVNALAYASGTEGRAIP